MQKKIKKMKYFTKYIFITGFSLIFLSVIMFLTGVGMFTARGNFHHLVIQLGEICFAFWLPFLLLGVFLLIIGVILSFAPKK